MSDMLDQAMPMLDVVVIGAGLAGLACAAALPGRRGLVLEREDRIGGRVSTRHEAGFVAELGAAFAYNAALAPSGFVGSPVELESGPLVLHDAERGTLLRGHEVRDCLLAERTPDDARRLALELEQFGRGERELDQLDADLRARLGAFMAVLHPGPIAAYEPRRQRDALLRFANRWREAGNDELVMALRERVELELMLGCEVVELVEREDRVELVVRDPAGERRRLACARVVLAVPTPAALQLLPELDEARRATLAAIEWQAGSVGVLELDPADELPEFSYLVSTRPELALVLRRDRQLSCYWLDALELDADALRERCELALAELGVGLAPGRTRWFAHQHWPTLAPVIGEGHRRWSAECLRPSERIVLAGDWTWLDDGKHMPYGMVAAVASGRRAAAMIREAERSESARST